MESGGEEVITPLPIEFILLKSPICFYVSLAYWKRNVHLLPLDRGEVMLSELPPHYRINGIQFSSNGIDFFIQK
jgi:hypothetical protein